MKIAALLLLIIGVFMILGLGMMYLLGFAMSFDAPGSTEDPKAWGMRLLMFLPILLCIVFDIVGWMAYAGGHFKKALIMSAIPVGIFGVLFLALMITSAGSYAKYTSQMAQEAKDAEQYPVQNYLRHVEGGTDTIIVFPNRIVAYRLYQGTQYHYAGPLGDLNESRTTLLYDQSTDTKLSMAELDQFTDATGRKFTDVYQVEKDTSQLYQNGVRTVIVH